MIFILLIWVLISMIFFTTGFSVVKIINRIFRHGEKPETLGIDEYFFLGFMTLSSVTGILSIWIPIGTIVLILVIALVFFQLLLNFREIRAVFKNSLNYLIHLKKPAILLISLLILFLMTIVVQKITWYDTGLYHAQGIQWIRNFSVVPGLGNIHGRLALNSMFLVISALFTFQIKDVLIFPLNGLCYTILAIKLFIKMWSEFTSGNDWKALLYSMVLLISLLMMIPLLNSTSPDIICGILIIYLFILLLNSLELPEKFSYSKTILLSIIVLTSVTYKISSLFLILTLLVNLKKDFAKKIIIILVISLVTIGPYIIRNYYLSGYLIYPYPSIDIFNVEWKIPFDRALYEKAWIVSWAKIPNVPYQDVINLKISEWFLPWIKSNDFNSKLILVVNALSVISLITMILKKERSLARIQIITLLNLIFWSLMAPNVRFAYGFLFVGFSITIAYFYKIIVNSRNNFISRYLKFALVCILLIVLARRVSLPLGIVRDPSLCLISAPFETVETKVLKSDFEYLIPAHEDQCFYSKIPCVPYPLTNVRLRGKDLQDGFKTIKVTN
jgi:hypothetical protein